MLFLRGTIRSRHFLVAFASLAVLLCCSFGYVTLKGLPALHESIMEEVRAELRVAKESTQQLVLTLSGMETSMVTLSQVNRVMQQPQFDHANMSDLIELSRLLYMLNYGSYIAEVQIYFGASNRVYCHDHGLFDAAEFYPEGFVEGVLASPGQTMWLAHMPGYRVGDGPALVRKLPAYRQGMDGFVAIALKPTALRALFPAQGRYKYRAALYVEGARLYPGDGGWAQQTPPQSNTLAMDGDLQYVVRLGSADKDDLLAVALLPRATVVRAQTRYALQMIAYLCGSLVLAFAVALGYSYAMLRPLADLAGRMRGKRMPARMMGRDYEPLSLALDDLLGHTSKMDELIEQSRQTVRERLLLDIIWGVRSPQQEGFAKVCAAIGIAPPCGLCCAFFLQLYAMEDTSVPHDQMAVYVRRHTEQSLSALCVVHGILFEHDKLLFLCHSLPGKDAAALLPALRALHGHVQNELHVSLAISVGTTGGVADLRSSYLRARNNLLYASAHDEESILFAQEGQGLLSVDHRLRQQIVDLALEPGAEARYSAACELLRAAGGESMPRKLGFLLSLAYVSLWERDIDVSVAELSAALQRVERVQGMEDAGRLLSQALHAATAGAYGEKDVREPYVARAIAFMDAHYAQDISIEQIAAAVHLSAAYLNRVFRLSTGHTLSEHLNALRIDRAKTLLRDTRLPLQRVATAVGYNDVRAFGRHFRKREGSSPADFRRGR